LFESVHAPIRIKALKDSGVLAPLAPTGAPENHWYQAVSKKCVTASQTLWFSQPETGTSAEQARGLGVLEKLHR